MRLRLKELASLMLVVGLPGWEPAHGGKDGVPKPARATYTQEGALDVWRLELPGRLRASTVVCPPADEGGESAEAQSPKRRTQPPCDLFVIVGARQGASEGEAAPDVHGLYRLSLDDETELQGLAWLPRTEDEDVGDRIFAAPRLEVLPIFGRRSLFVSWQGQGFLYRLGETKPVTGNASPERLRRIVGPEQGAPWRALSVFEGQPPFLLTTDVGVLQVHNLVEDHLQAVSHRLPVQVKRRPQGLELRSPPVRPLSIRPPVLAVGPEENGQIRLRTLLLDPSQPSSQETAEPPSPNAGVEPEDNVRWSLLPGLERVIASKYWWLKGRPVLAVVTLRADKVGIFERKKLRLFGLGSDRSRAGSRPFFATFTASRMWQKLTVDVVQAPGKGYDLVVVQPEGMGGKKLAVDRYVGVADSGFAPKPLRSLIRVPESWWKYGDDWTGDGVPDLVSLSSGVLHLFRGLGIQEKDFLEREPSWQHQILAPERRSATKEGKSEPLLPRRQAIYKRGILVVRSRYAEGNDLVEVLTPRGGVETRVVASLSSAAQ